MKKQLLFSVGVLSAIGGASAFVPAQTAPNAIGSRKSSSHGRDGLVSVSDANSPQSLSSRTALLSDKKKGGLDESMRNKLVTESIAPWRTLRLFLYGSFGSGAFVGGLLNGSEAIANSNSPDFNLQVEVRSKNCSAIQNDQMR